ncbi:MAG: WD40 repeat domain-containing protein [Candidatus Eremiobacteraeota bacterium]|nr:WD40 repeat domain-containing protein [Candidatus Eremiobacteraeota bacterium]
MWRLPELEPLGLIAEHDESITGEVFLPGGDIVTCSLDGEIRKTSVKKQKITRKKNFGLPIMGLAFDQKNNKIVIIDYEGGISFLSPEDFGDFRRYSITAGNLLSMALLPDGKIYCSGDKGWLYLVDQGGNIIIKWRHGVPGGSDLR